MAVRGGDPAPEVFLIVGGPGGGELPVKGEHPVVPLPLRRVGDVDGAEGEMRQVASAIRFTPVPDAKDFDGFFLLVELVDNPIGSNPNAPIAF